jgi:hypothetical protein
MRGADRVTSTQIVSPERPWRAGASVVAGVVAGWYVAWRSPSVTALAVGSALVAASVCLALLIARSHLDVTDHGLTDRRTFRVVRLPWDDIVEFGVGRPGGPWGGFCVIAVCRDRSSVDLLSTRAYSRLPSAHHLDELHRICWTLEERAASRPSARG